MAQSLAQYQQMKIICNIFSKQTVNTAIAFNIFLQDYKTIWVKSGWYTREYNSLFQGFRNNVISLKNWIKVKRANEIKTLKISAKNPVLYQQKEIICN